MSQSMQSSLTLIGRLLLAALFLPAGLGKLAGFSGTVGYIASVGLPLPTLAAALAAAVEIVAGLALVLGWGTRWAAAALALFTLVATFAFHAFWSVPAEQAMMQQLIFSKNTAVVGGLLVLAAFGAGAWSLDARRSAVAPGARLASA